MNATRKVLARAKEQREGTEAVEPQNEPKRRGRPSEMDGPVRFNLYLPKEAYDGLEELRKSTGKASIAETVRAAVQLYRLMQDSVSSGKHIVIEDKEEDTRERVFPT